MRDFICRFLLISSFVYLCISTLYLPMQKFLKILFRVSWLVML